MKKENSQNHGLDGLKDDTDLKSAQSEQSSKSVIQTTATTKPFYNSTIPSDWEVKKGEDISDKITKGSSPNWQGFQYQDEGVLFVTSENVRDGFLDVSEPKYLPIAFNDKLRNSVLQKGDILINIVGASIGRSCIYNVDTIANTNQAVCILRPKESVLREYISYFLQLPKSVDKLLNTQSDSARPNLTLEDIRNFHFLLPPLPEQKAIAHILSLMDSTINKNNLLVAKKQLQKKWLMQNLLTGKKRLGKDGRQKTGDGSWKTIKLGEAFEFLKTYSISRDGLTKEGDGSSVYCIHYGDIHAFYENEFLDFSSQKNIPQIIDDAQIVNEKDYLKDGDIIMADASEDYNGVGEVVEVVNLNEKIAVGGLHTIVLRGNPEFVVNGFRGYLFSSEAVRNVLRKMATGSSVYSVTKTTLQNLSLKIPNSLKEQTAIAQVLQAADKEIQLLKTKSEKLREQKKGLMQVLLTGKKRLKI